MAHHHHERRFTFPTDRPYHHPSFLVPDIPSSHWPSPFQNKSLSLPDSASCSTVWNNNTQPLLPSWPLDTAEYPESSQRTVISSPPSICSAIAQPEDTYREGPRSSPTSSDQDDNKTLWDNQLYAKDDQFSLPGTSHSPSPPVKEEPEDSDDCFIVELAAPTATSLVQSLLPPTEVPLRATQASKEMRKMMGVFRLNPFTMHNSKGLGASSPGAAPQCYGEDIGPLEEEPVTLEFQVELNDELAQMTLGDESSLRCFSPDFGDDDLVGSVSETLRNGEETGTESDSYQSSGGGSGAVDPWTYTPPSTHIPPPPSSADTVSTLNFHQYPNRWNWYPDHATVMSSQRQVNSQSPAEMNVQHRRPLSEQHAWPPTSTSSAYFQPVPSRSNPGYLPTSSIPSSGGLARRWSLPSDPNTNFFM